ncbi:MAG: hypothetical protein ACYCX2_02370 [Christensenellales bacterium]
MRKSVLFLIIVLCLSLTVGCAKTSGPAAQKTTEPAQTTAQSQEPANTPQSGSQYETDDFSLIVPQGWEIMDIDGGVQLYKMSGEVFEVHFRGYNMSGDEAKQQVESTARQYSGTAPSEVDLLGKRFWTTEFTAAGVLQATYLCIDEGVMISVKYGGPGFKTNPEFKAILDSIALK